MTASTTTRPRRRSPQPVPRAQQARTVLWRVATVRRARAPLATGQHVVITERGVTQYAPRLSVITARRDGVLVGAEVPTASLRILPDTYRARPCLAPCSDDGDCWTSQRPGVGRAHHDDLTAAVTACVTHYARMPR